MLYSYLSADAATVATISNQFCLHSLFIRPKTTYSNILYVTQTFQNEFRNRHIEICSVRYKLDSGHMNICKLHIFEYEVNHIHFIPFHSISFDSIHSLRISLFHFLYPFILWFSSIGRQLNTRFATNTFSKFIEFRFCVLQMDSLSTCQSYCTQTNTHCVCVCVSVYFTQLYTHFVFNWEAKKCGSGKFFFFVHFSIWFNLIWELASFATQHE